MIAIQKLLSRPVAAGVSASKDEKRRRRWHSFQVVFAFAYLGIVLDEVTTALGVGKSGSAYEQNPLGAYLIGTTGWLGLFILLTALSALCYVSCRVVFWRMRPFWGGMLNAVLAIVTVVRWLAVATAVLYIIQPGR
jgi:hypothetical protein